MISPRNLGTHQLYDRGAHARFNTEREYTRELFHCEGSLEGNRDRLSEDVVQSSSLEIFRTKSDTVLGILLHFSRGVGRDLKRSFFISDILWFYEISLEGFQSLVIWIEQWAVGCPAVHSSEIYVIGYCDLTSVGSWAPHRHSVLYSVQGGTELKGWKCKEWWVEINPGKYNQYLKNSAYFLKFQMVCL